MKNILCFICAFAIAFLLLACIPMEANAFNRSFFDLTYNFDEAIIFRADGEQSIKVREWCDFENSDMIQVTADNGDVYLTHSSNVILISH